MADDILKALSDSYSNASSNMDSDKKNVNEAVGKTVATKRMKEYAQELENIKKVRNAEADRYKELYKAELNAGKYSQKVKADLLKQEISHYTSLYNLNKELHTEQTKILEAERDVYAGITEKGKITLHNQFELYSLKIKEQNLEKQTIEYRIKQFEKRVDSVKKGLSTVINHIFKDLNELSNIYLFNNWKKGISDLQTQYETNFTEISGRLGVSSGIDTHNFIGNVLNNVKSNDEYMKGLNFNNEVFPQITDAVKRGFQGEKAEEIGLTTAIDKKIMPWLDTTSDTWTNLQYNLSDNLLAQLKGQQLQLQATQEGNRILQNGVVSEITNSLAPTLLNIDANTTDVSTMTGQAQAMANALMDQGYSKQDAVKAVNQVIDAYQNPFKALRSNNTADKLYALGGLQGGDIASALTFANNFLQTGVNGNFATSGAYEALGFVTNGLTRNTNWMKDMDVATQAANGYVSTNLQGTYNDKVNNLTEYVTATQKNDNEEQNKAVIKVFNDAFGNHILDIDKMILDEIINIKTWLITGLIAGLATSLGNKFIDLGISGLSKKSFLKNLIGSQSGKTITYNGGRYTSELQDYMNKTGRSSLHKGETIQTGGSGLLGLLNKGGSNLTGTAAGSTKATIMGGLGVAGITGGVALGSYGISESIKDFKDGNTGTGISNAIGGGLGLAGAGALTAGMLGVGAANAWNPLGWGLLIASGVTLLGTAIYKGVSNVSGAAEHVEEEYTERLKSIREQNRNEKLAWSDISKQLDETSDLDKKRNLLINSGLLSQADVNKARDMDANELEKLTSAYIQATKDFSKDIDTNIQKYKKEDRETAEAQQLGMRNAINEKMDAGEINENWLSASDAALYTLFEDLETRKKSGEEFDKHTKRAYKELSRAYADGALTKKELNAIINEGFFNDSLEKAKFSSDIMNNAYQNYINVGGNEVESATTDWIKRNNYTLGVHHGADRTTEAITLAQKALDQTSKEGAEEYLKQAKAKGYKSSEFSEIKNAADKWDLTGYKLGSSYIPYDMIAQLHAGERVLTANQNKEYTKELETGNGSIIVNSIQDVVSAIQNQTKTIIDYLSTMNFNNSSGFKKMSMLPSMGNTKVTL